MSQERIENDFYPTPARLTKVLLSRISFTGSILEPCAGDRAGSFAGSQSEIANELSLAGYKVESNDITEGEQFDATTMGYWQDREVDWVVMNPPFKEANLIVENSLVFANKGVCALLRLSFLEPTKGRRTLLNQFSDNLRYAIVVNPRPRFRADSTKTDSVTVAWLVWDKNFSWAEKKIKCPFLFAHGW